MLALATFMSLEGTVAPVYIGLKMVGMDSRSKVPKLDQNRLWVLFAIQCYLDGRLSDQKDFVIMFFLSLLFIYDKNTRTLSMHRACVY